MKRRIVLTLIILCSLSGLTKAQDYITAVGLRAGFSNGATIKHFVTQHAALEGIVSASWFGFDLTGLYEIHHFGIETEGLNFYYGGGAHMGMWNGSNIGRSNLTGTYATMGIDGIVGMEYNFKDIPLNVSLDWKPVINFTGFPGFWGYGFALSGRYIF